MLNSPFPTTNIRRYLLRATFDIFFNYTTGDRTLLVTRTLPHRQKWYILTAARWRRLYDALQTSAKADPVEYRYTDESKTVLLHSWQITA